MKNEATAMKKKMLLPKKSHHYPPFADIYPGFPASFPVIVVAYLKEEA